MPQTPITVVTGYLGAGKTTLLRNVLAHADKKIAVIMNEFGEIAIDSKVIQGKNVDIAELAGGCVCCSITGEFAEALRELQETTKPEHIILETTGVADPEAIIHDIRESLPGVRLDSVVTIADAYELSQFPSLGETAQSQIRLADVMLINKADLVSEAQLQEAETLLRKLNSAAVMMRTVRCSVDTNVLFGFHVEKETSPEAHGDLAVESFSVSLDGSLSREKFLAFVARMPKAIYRAKGFVVLDGKSHLFNYVNGRHELEPFPEEKTELVFIGKEASSFRDVLLAGLKACTEA
ncbi:MAG: GTP-binding protein [Candidatus Aenigmarchaeota archaeon]|nr:GTP-binding protein [Candidatus Aenigmarchaeota archaeon]